MGQVNGKFIEGALEIPIELFPQEIINKIMNNPGYVPKMSITMNGVFLKEGVSLVYENSDIRVDFDFVSMDITIEEAETT